MARVWLALTLRPSAETGATVEELESDIARILGEDFELFVPAIFGSKTQKLGKTRQLMEGYIFLHAEEDHKKLSRVEGSSYFDGFLCEKRKYSIIPDSDIEKLRAQLEELRFSGVCEGVGVRILNGVYESLCGVVVSVDTEALEADVEIKLSSKVMVVKLPLGGLAVEDEEIDS